MTEGVYDSRVMRTGTLPWPALALAIAPAVHARAAQAPVDLDAGLDTVELEAAWGPIASSTYHLREQHSAVAEAMDAGPRTPRARHSVDALRALLPPPDADVLWDLDPRCVTPFLSQLHPGVTPRLRHAHLPARLEEMLRDQGTLDEWTPKAIEGGRGTVLRATEKELAVLLRVHVEFELVPDEMFLLPAQFEGLLVWDRATDRPRSFHLALPSRDTNFDLNYRDSVDIGHLPLMQVATPGASAAGPEADAARRRLRESFYPSAKIRWRPLAEALARAKANGRRLHVMQLFGTLDDESC